MQERKVILTGEAIYDITDIADYIEAEFGRERADRFQNDIKVQMQDIKLMGEMFGKTKLFYRNLEIYKKPFPPSIIFYIINEPQNEIHILRVLREERNWARMLKTQKDYTY